MAVIEVALAGRSYDVVIGPALLDNVTDRTSGLLRKKTVPIVADATARSFHGDRLERSLVAAGHVPQWFEVSPGEASKNWSQLRKLTDWLLAQGVDRSDHVLALGGGVVGDLAGFACAVTKRGCGFIQLPTTLLAQVDSSVGGKTAINTAAGKNLIGAFHQPSLVLADTDTLRTLPVRELRAGYAEIVKYGILGDAPFFDWCEKNGRKVVELDEAALLYATGESVKAKARIVAQDERETTGSRALLNLGHTFGHALEAQAGYSDRLLHGEAVAVGMVLAARYSERLGYLAIADAERITRAVDDAGLPSEVSALALDCDGTVLTDHMRHDKKMDAGALPFILLRDIGTAFLDREISLKDVAAFLDEQLQAH